MKFEQVLEPARLVRRYKRFLADMELGNGSVRTVHCPNTGSMMGCDRPGMKTWLSRSDNPQRKYPWTWELVEAAPGVLVGIHTGRSNRLIAEALEGSAVAGIEPFEVVRREYRPPGANSRFDLLARDRAGCPVLMEIKNVTAGIGDGVGVFPDAVSRRAKKHVDELARLAGDGRRVVLVFCVQREDVNRVRPAAEIDPDYARAVDQALAAGLEVLALGCSVSPWEIKVVRELVFEPA